MVTERIEILEDEQGTFTFQCPKCSLKRKAKSPKVKKFKIKCKCGTRIPVILNARGQYRKETDLNALVIKDKRKEERKTAHFKGILETNSIRFYVVIKDMSVNGLKCYFNSNHYTLHIGERISIEYTLKSASKRITILDRCTVKWVSGDYFGVQCDPLNDYSPEQKQKGFYVFPPEVEDLVMDQEHDLDFSS